MKRVLITGTGSGIGKACKEIFLQNGFEVIGLDINRQEECQNFRSYQVDITNFYELSKIKNELKGNNIIFDSIINVAGIHKMASFVETDLNKIKQVIDVNLMGPIAVNNLFHELLIEKGKIVIVTSEVASFDPLPFNGLYSVSKIALENYAQALRQELNLLGQKVITILPGAIETPLSKGSIDDTKCLADSTNLYKKESSKFVTITKKFMGKPLSPNKLAKKIFKVTLKKKTRLRYKIHHNFGLVLLSILPKRLQCYLIKLILK